MGTSKKQVEANRDAILGAAERLFRERGIDAVGIVELMEAAGLTRGGFYNHFDSKSALVDAVLTNALTKANDRLSASLDGAARRGVDPLDAQLDWYLSAGHRADILEGCSVSGFATDVQRLDESVRTQFARALETYARHFADAMSITVRDQDERRRRALGMVSTMVGALLLSRAVADVAPALAEELLVEGKRTVKTARTSSGFPNG